MDRAGQAGFVAKAVVYATIGVLALEVALGKGGALINVRDTPNHVARQPFGDVLLILLAIGLACYALWLLGQAAFDPDRRDRSAKRIAIRLGRAGSAVFHASLAVGAFQTWAGHRPGHHGQSWIHTVLSHPGGALALIALGIGLIGYGVYQLYSAYTAKFRKQLETRQMSATERTWAIRVGRFGLAARGIVLPVAGVLFIQAGRHANAAEAGSTAAAMREIARQRWGTALLAVVAAGFVAYALYMLVSARYRRELA
jgi:hypothetical protein